MDVVSDFGDEWDQYDQSGSDLKLEEAFSQYFSIFPNQYLNPNAVGFDAGCGSGRWAKFIAPKVKQLICFDPSHKALKVLKVIYLNLIIVFLNVQALMNALLKMNRWILATA